MTLEWTDCVKKKMKAYNQTQGKFTLPFAEINWRLDDLIFYNIVILKFIKDFIFCKSTAVYYLCFKCKRQIL